MPPAISFPAIPSNWPVPLFWMDFDNSQANSATPPQRALLLGQTVTAEPMVPTYVTTPAMAAGLFGAGSMLARMVTAYRNVDPVGELWVIPLADAGGATAATGSIAFTGPATAAGTLALYIAGQVVNVAVTSGMTAAQLATAVVAAITALTTVPVTAAIDGTHNYQVDLTARNKGLVGNSIDVRLNYYGPQSGEILPAGITAAVTAMSGGATDPDLAAVEALIANNTYDFIALGGYTGSTQLNEMQTIMADRWAYNEAVYGHVWSAKMDADATGATNLTFGATRNDPHMSVVSYEPSPSPPWEVAATWCGASAVSLKADPAEPTWTLALPKLLPPAKGSSYALSTVASLLQAGLSVQSYQAGGVLILRNITTYQKNAFGAADNSYFDVQRLYQLMTIARTLKSVTTSKYGRVKLADNGTRISAGSNMVTPDIVKGELITQYAQLVDDGIADDIDAFTAGLIVQRNVADPTRLDVLFDPYLINGLAILAVLNQFHAAAPPANG